MGCSPHPRREERASSLEQRLCLCFSSAAGSHSLCTVSKRLLMLPRFLILKPRGLLRVLSAPLQLAHCSTVTDPHPRPGLQALFGASQWMGCYLPFVLRRLHPVGDSPFREKPHHSTAHISTLSSLSLSCPAPDQKEMSSRLDTWTGSLDPGHLT